MKAPKKNRKRPKAKLAEKDIDSKKRIKLVKDKKKGLTENPAWMFKEPVDIKNPSMWNEKEE